MWKFEKVFTDVGAELFNANHNTYLGDLIASTYDGRYVWCVSTKGLAIFEIFGPSSGDEPTVDELDDLTFEPYDQNGITWRQSVRLASTANVLTSANRTIDGVTTVAGDRVLLKNQTDPSENGVWVTGTTWTKTSDDSFYSAFEVQTGTLNGGKYFIKTGEGASSFEPLSGRHFDGLKKVKLMTFYSLEDSFFKRSGRDIALSLVPAWVGGTGSTVVSGITVHVLEERDDLTIVTEFGTELSSFSPYFICKAGTKMLISETASISKVHVFDIATQRYEETIDVSFATNSNLAFVDGKFWVVGAEYSDDEPQKLYAYNLTTDAWSNVNIPVRPQSTRAWIAGTGTSVYVTNYNGVSITRFNASTVAFTSRIRTNSSPTRMWIDPTGTRVFVNSFAGMLTQVDVADDDVFNDYGTEETALQIGVDPSASNYIWFVDTEGRIALYNLDNLQVLETGSGEDWHIENVFSDVQWIETIPSTEFEDSNTDLVMSRPYLVALDGNKIRLVAIDNYLVRDNFFELNSQGAVTGGTLQYFGEGP